MFWNWVKKIFCKRKIRDEKLGFFFKNVLDFWGVLIKMYKLW